MPPLQIAPQTCHQHSEMTENQEQMQEQMENTNNLQIIQINLNKSKKAHLDIINGRTSKHYDIMLIQEPHTTTFNATHMPPNF